MHARAGAHDTHAHAIVQTHQHMCMAMHKLEGISGRYFESLRFEPPVPRSVSMEILEKRLVSTCELQSGTDMVSDAGAVGAVCSADVPGAFSRALAPSVEQEGVLLS